MKKIGFILGSLVAFSAMAQEHGQFEVHDFEYFKLHVYYTNDVMADVSYIVEGTDKVVTMEQPLFRVNVDEFDAYLENLGKPVEQRIVDYHVGGTGSHETLMPEGMPDFIKGPVYGGMMQNFATLFGDAITESPTGKTQEVVWGTIATYAGVSFEFRHGAATDFPAASLLIGGKIYYTHWAPSKSHVSHLQVSSPAAIEAEIAEAELSLQSGAELFIGGHGQTGTKEAVAFKILYLKKMKEVLAESKNVEEFVAAMTAAFPNLSGAGNLTELAKNFYK